MRRNTDVELRLLERQARAGDVDALLTFVDRVGRRTGDWVWVVRAMIGAGPSATNAAMDRTDFPTWNRLAPAVYAGAASWPETDLVRAQEILHERLLDRGCGSEEAPWEACAFPVFAVLIGGRVPARMVNDPDGVPRLLSYQAGDPRGAWSVCRRWQPREQITRFPEEYATIFLAVLDEERGAVTCATATVQGSAGSHFNPVYVTHWRSGRGLGVRPTDSSPQNWLEWAREIDPWDRLILPLPVLRAWRQRAQAFLARQGHPSVTGQANVVGGEPGQTGPGGAVEIVGGEPNPPDDIDHEDLDVDCDDGDPRDFDYEDENEEPMNVVYAHPSGGRLWQGGNTSCMDCDELDRLGVKVVVLAAMEHQPSLPGHIDVVRARLDDDPWMKRPMAIKVARCADEVSDLLAERIRRGHSALSSCWMGWNRSGLMSALAIIKLTRCDPDRAISLVRRARGPNALSNPVFVAIIRGLAASPRCGARRR